MSNRSTPGPAHYIAAPVYQTTQVSGNVPDPTASSSRWAQRAHSNSTYRPSVPPPFTRRESDKSIHGRQSVAASVVGTATPTASYRRLRRAAGKDDGHGGAVNGHGGSGMKEDWAALEPDEVFRRLPVNEVKRVESKMRSEALNKQSELRSMVGTRYRDLLTSATQITSLHSSSLRLSDSLKTISKTCRTPTIDTVNITLDGNDSVNLNDNDAEDVVQLLPIAAHMKLLLDAPEALYSYLSHHSFLNAAFLWLIARVVREGLTAMPEESSGPYLPLLQKQWETLLPFRGQIVQRATASLRSRDKLDPKTLSKTLLAIMLLDNLPLPDALSLLLSQRTKALRDILAHSAEASSSKSKLITGNRARRNSRISTANATREAVQERDTIARVLTEAVYGLLETVVAAQTLFDKRRKTTLEGESLLEEAMRLVQKGESVPHLQSVTPAKQTSHQRRASRLASISLPMPKHSPGAVRPPVSAAEILQNLPSSQILLRHLPSSITAWTPFITPSPPPALNDKLRDWRKSSVELLNEAVPSWLSGLKSVSDIWEVRSALAKILTEGEFEQAIKAALEDEWGNRVREVWTVRLNQLVDDAETRIRDAGEKIRSSGETTDTTPETVLFSDLAFPSAPASTLAVSGQSSAFSSFISQLKKRTSYRTPLLDEVLTELEAAAAGIKSDMKGLPSALFSDYSEKVQDALEKLVKVLERVLESMGSARGDGKEGIQAELFVGRVAIYLAKESSFVSDISGEGQLRRDDIETALVSVHASSTIRWRERSVKEALVLLAPLFDPYRGASEIRAFWQGSHPTIPSAAINESLQSLVQATRNLGLPPKLSEQLPIVPDLMNSFVTQSKLLEGWKSQLSVGEGVGAAQAALDVGLLVWLAGENVAKDEVVQLFLAKIPEPLQMDYPTSLLPLIEEHVRRTQLLLSPLTAHLTAFPSTPATEQKSYGFDRHQTLLRFGQPSAARSASAVGSEFRSPVPVAKPRPRMGLLSIAA